MDRANPRVPGTERSLLATLLGVDFLKALVAGRLGRPVRLDGLAGRQAIDKGFALAAVNEVTRVGDHRGEIAADGATVVGHLVVFEVRRRRSIPVRAAGNAGACPAD